MLSREIAELLQTMSAQDIADQFAKELNEAMEKEKKIKAEKERKKTDAVTVLENLLTQYNPTGKSAKDIKGFASLVIDIWDLDLEQIVAGFSI